jgi:hypothetical protein
MALAVFDSSRNVGTFHPPPSLLQPVAKSKAVERESRSPEALGSLRAASGAKWERAKWDRVKWDRAKWG